MDYLIYSCSKITDNGLSHLSTLINLNTINLNYFSIIIDNLNSLNLTGSNISDNGLTHLLTLINLKKLNLESCLKITDNTLSHLSTLININTLNLAQTK